MQNVSGGGGCIMVVYVKIENTSCCERVLAMHKNSFKINVMPFVIQVLFRHKKNN